MKKVLVALMLLTTVCLNAQEFKKFRLGLNASPNLGWIKSNDKEFETDGVRAGIGGGLVMDFYFSKNYGITTGLQIMNVGGKVKYDAPGIYIAQTFKNQYVQIPFGLKMKTNDFSGFNIYGIFGITAEYCFRARYDAEFDVLGFQGSVENEDAKDNDYTRSLRLGLNVGLGTEYNIAGSTSLFVGLTYNNGIIGAYKKQEDSNGNVTNPSANLNYFALNLGVLF
jgi:hypothetical protein